MRPAVKVSELDVVLEGLFDVLFEVLPPEGPLLELEFLDTPGPPFSPVTPCLLYTSPSPRDYA